LSPKFIPSKSEEIIPLKISFQERVLLGTLLGHSNRTVMAKCGKDERVNYYLF